AHATPGARTPRKSAAVAGGCGRHTARACTMVPTTISRGGSSARRFRDRNRRSKRVQRAWPPQSVKLHGITLYNEWTIPAGRLAVHLEVDTFALAAVHAVGGFIGERPPR